MDVGGRGKGGFSSSTHSTSVFFAPFATGMHSLASIPFLLFCSGTAFQENNSHRGLAGMDTEMLEGAEVCGLCTF